MTAPRGLASKLSCCWRPTNCPGSDGEDEPPPLRSAPRRELPSKLAPSLEQEARRQLPDPDYLALKSPPPAPKLSMFTNDSSATGLSSIPNSSNRTSHCYEPRCSHASLDAQARHATTSSLRAVSTLTIGFRGSWHQEAAGKLDPEEDPTSPAFHRPSLPGSRNTFSWPFAASSAPTSQPHSSSSYPCRAAEPGGRGARPAPAPSSTLSARPICQHQSISLVSKASSTMMGSVGGCGSGGSAAGPAMPPGYWPALAAIMGRRLVRKSGSASMHQDRRLPSANSPTTRPQGHRRSKSERKVR